MITVILINIALAAMLWSYKYRHDKQVEYEKFCYDFYEE